MTKCILAAALSFIALALHADDGPKESPPTRTGRAKAELRRPERFPHRIWAACDFEAQTPDYGWFGERETKGIQAYPGNATALRAEAKPYGTTAARMAGMNPVPGPRMGERNGMYCRYLLRGAGEATFQHFNLSVEDNHHVRVEGLKEGEWSELTVDFWRDARRNDGSATPFAKGDRMDDLKVFLGSSSDSKDWELRLDDVIFFANDPAVPPEKEPFPRRVMYVAAFDTGIGEKERVKYFPGDFEVVTTGAPDGAWWGVARAVARPDGRPGRWIRLGLEPLRSVGERTKLRFRAHIRGARQMTVQIFDATVQDNRHVVLDGLKEGSWETLYVDFARDARRNDGTKDRFAAGNRVDDIFFFFDAKEGQDAGLFVDEVVLFDAGE